MPIDTSKLPSITESKLNKLKKNNTYCLIYSGKNLELSLSYHNGYFILVRKIYKEKETNKRSFNHIKIDDDLILKDLKNMIPEIFQEAIKKIENGKCLKLQFNKTFEEISSCDLPHS